MHGGAIRGGDVAERRFVERSPLFGVQGPYCDSYANGYLRPDECLERKEAAARLCVEHPEVSLLSAWEAAGTAVARRRSHRVRGA